MKLKFEEVQFRTIDILDAEDDEKMGELVYCPIHKEYELKIYLSGQNQYIKMRPETVTIMHEKLTELNAQFKKEMVH